MNQYLHHYFSNDTFRLISLLFSSEPLQSFKKLLTSFEFIVCQFFTHCPILNTDLLNYCKAISACVSKCHIFFCNSITLMTNFILLTTCHLLKYFVSNLNMCLSFTQSLVTNSLPRAGHGWAPGFPGSSPPSRRPRCRGCSCQAAFCVLANLGG